MEYYSAIKRKRILIHATTWMNLDDIALSKKKHQTQKGKYLMVSHVESKKLNSQNQRIEQWLPEIGSWGRQRDVGQRVQIFTYKMVTFQRYNIHLGDHS